MPPKGQHSNWYKLYPEMGHTRIICDEIHSTRTHTITMYICLHDSHTCNTLIGHTCTYKNQVTVQIILLKKHVKKAGLTMSDFIANMIKLIPKRITSTWSGHHIHIKTSMSSLDFIIQWSRDLIYDSLWLKTPGRY